MAVVFFGLGLTVYFFLHSFFAALSVKRWFFDRQIIRIEHYRIFYNSIALLAFLPVLFLYQACSSKLLFNNSIVYYLGLALFVAGSISLYFALQQYDLWDFSGLRAPNQDTTDEANQLSTSGYNTYVRHPLYFSTLLMMLGFFLLWPSLAHLVLLIISTVYVIIGTLLEEQKLVAEFGASYEQYQKEVPMLIPRFRWEETDF